MKHFKKDKVEEKDKTYEAINLAERRKKHYLMNIRTILVFIILFSMIFTSCTISKNETIEKNKQELPEFIPYRVGSKWGYCNRDRKVVIQPAYDEANFFSEGLAPVNINGKFGFIDENGQIVIKPFYYSALYFHNGLACVEFYSKDQKAYKYGFINKKGEIVINPVYDEVFFDFKDNYAVIAIGGKYGVIDKSGKIVVPTEYGQLFVVEDNLGLFAAQPQLIGAGYGLLDAKRNIIMPFNYGWIGKFVDGLALVSTLSGKCGFINTKGEFVIEAKYDGADDFHEGLATVRVGGKNGFIDETGKIVIKTEYDEASWFSEGLAPVKLGEHWGVINTEGRIVIKPTYDYIYSYSGGLAFAELNEKKSFIDSKGKVVLNVSDLFDKLEYTTDYYFKNGLLAVYSHPFGTVINLVGYIDKNGAQYWED